MESEMNVPSDAASPDGMRFTASDDVAEMISWPFPWDFLVLLGLVLLSPVISRPREVSMYERAFELQALLYAIPYLVVVVLLGLSIARNRRRSPAIRWISGAIAVSAFLVSIYLMPF